MLRRLPLTLALLLWASRAHANGALPDSLSLLTPAALPHDVVLATNFGLVLSHDDGQHWVWSCEQAGNAYGILYQAGPPPLNRIFTISTDAGGRPQLGFSDDDSCSWRVATIPGTTAPVVDAFADPSDANRVVAVDVAPTDGGSVYQVRESGDGGATLSKLLYTAAGGDFITGIEIARSAPGTIYLTMGSGIPSVPTLARSTDGGITWKTFSLGGVLPANVTARLFAIDPTDPTRVYLRVSGGENDRVAVVTIDASDDVAVTMALTFMNGVITAFTRLPNGHLFVGGTIGVTPVAYLSVDNGLIFQALPTPPTLKGSSARGGTLYAVTDDKVDGFAIATSGNEGQSWQPLMRYDQIAAIQSCVAALCQDDCGARAELGQWPEPFCAAEDPTAVSDAGVPPDDAGSGDGGTTPPPDGGGCGCATTNTGAVPGAPAAVVPLLALIALGRRTRKRPKARA